MASPDSTQIPEGLFDPMIYLLYFSTTMCVLCAGGWLVKKHNPYLVFLLLGIVQYVIFKMLTDVEQSINIFASFGLIALAILLYDRIQA